MTVNESMHHKVLQSLLTSDRQERFAHLRFFALYICAFVQLHSCTFAFLNLGTNPVKCKSWAGHFLHFVHLCWIDGGF